MSWFELSWPEYDVLWEHLKLGPYPTVLQINGHGHTRDERARLMASTWDSLQDKGYSNSRDIDTELEWCLRTLAQPEWEIDARLHLDPTGPRISGLAASNGRHAVLSMLDTESLALRGTNPDRVVTDVISLLPECPAGSGKSVTIPAEDLDAAAARAGQDANTLAVELTRRGLASGQAGQIAGVLGDVWRFGQFGVSRTTNAGKRARASHVISFYDGPFGRFSFVRKSTGSREWVTLVGADDRVLARQLDELRAQLD